MIDCSMKIRGEELNKYTNDYEKKLVEIADYYSSKGHPVLLLTSNNNQDYPAAKRIYNDVKFKENVTVFEYNGNYSSIFELYKNAKYVISTRLHTLILAWDSGTPVVPIIYDLKVRNILESYKFDNLVIELQNIQNIAVDEINRSLETYKFTNLNSIIIDSEKQFKNLDEFFLHKTIND